MEALPPGQAKLLSLADGALQRYATPELAIAALRKGCDQQLNRSIGQLSPGELRFICRTTYSNPNLAVNFEKGLEQMVKDDVGQLGLKKLQERLDASTDPLLKMRIEERMQDLRTGRFELCELRELTNEALEKRKLGWPSAREASFLGILKDKPNMKDANHFAAGITLQASKGWARMAIATAAKPVAGPGVAALVAGAQYALGATAEGTLKCVTHDGKFAERAKKTSTITADALASLDNARKMTEFAGKLAAKEAYDLGADLLATYLDGRNDGVFDYQMGLRSDQPTFAKSLGGTLGDAMCD
jgi:hypothetical protein